MRESKMATVPVVQTAFNNVAGCFVCLITSVTSSSATLSAWQA